MKMEFEAFTKHIAEHVARIAQKQPQLRTNPSGSKIWNAPGGIGYGLISFIVLGLTAPAFSSGSEGDTSRQVRDLTGARTRIAWVQDQENRDTFAQGDRLILCGFDSDDGNGERTIVPEPGSCAKPLITPRGDRVVFSNRKTGKICVVNWDGSQMKAIADGFALDVWSDPETGAEWIYAGTGELDDKGESFSEVRRFLIDKPSDSQQVWSKAPASRDSFQLSLDGKRACGLFPWPRSGVAVLPDKEWKQFGTGCWTSMSPDNSYMAWVFDGAHRNVIIHQPDAVKSWKVGINRADGIDGHEVYHPRWSNHIRFMMMTGPYKLGSGSNRIRGAGPDVEIYLGRFSADMGGIERWVKITSNGKADFYPDAWVEGGEKAALERPAAGQEDRAQNAKQQVMRFDALGRLTAKTETPDPESIAPYKRALGVYTYEVVEPLDSMKEGDSFLVAHWVIVDKKQVQPLATETGKVYRMALERMIDRPDLEGDRLIMDSDGFELPMFVESSVSTTRDAP
ncbi:MAG: hypothetical protein O3B24_02200 [Verrucomicrobia bacterium]|nr:hypothetical protein [Verrucomicrobiota bacterium]